MDKKTVSKTEANVEANHVIEKLGGTCAAARRFKIKPSSVAEWRKRGLPPARKLHLKEVSPEVFN